MKVQLHKKFKKQYDKLKALQSKTDERLVLFMKHSFDSMLNNHALKGKYQGCRSINITGDFRAVYKLIDQNTAYFLELDTHSNLYK